VRLWWRRNWLPLILAAVLVPLTIGVTFGSEWWQYFSGRPVVLTSTGVGTPVHYADTQITVDSASRIGADSAQGRAYDLPGGTDLIVVTVTIDPKRVHADGSSALCTMELEELDGTTVTRHWNDATFDAIDFAPADGFEYGCNSELQHSYRAQVPFVVPAAAGAGDRDLALLLYSADVLPDALRIRL
jgi:hypothetical protein